MVRTPLDALHHLQRLAAGGELDRLCEEFGVEVLVVFGSAAQPARSHEARDLDLAVRFRSSAPRLLDFTAAVLEYMDTAWLRELDRQLIKESG